MLIGPLLYFRMKHLDKKDCHKKLTFNPQDICHLLFFHLLPPLGQAKICPTLGFMIKYLHDMNCIPTKLDLSTGGKFSLIFFVINT